MNEYDVNDKLGLHRASIYGRSFTQRFINAEVNSYNAVKKDSDVKLEEQNVKLDTIMQVKTLTDTVVTPATDSLQPLLAKPLNFNPVLLVTADKANIKTLFSISDTYVAFQTPGTAAPNGLHTVGRANTIRQAINYASTALDRAKVHADPAGTWAKPLFNEIFTDAGVTLYGGAGNETVEKAIFNLEDFYRNLINDPLNLDYVHPSPVYAVIDASLGFN
jgi:hypothetical protein